MLIAVPRPSPCSRTVYSWGIVAIVSAKRQVEWAMKCSGVWVGMVWLAVVGGVGIDPLIRTLETQGSKLIQGGSSSVKKAAQVLAGVPG